MINTHLSGEVELKLNGHTNICGTNASGKTTLQRLVPVFYGEYPSKVVPATRDSFERWYLPTESSFIIYEYLRPSGELAQTVMSSSGDGKGVQYRFVGKAFDMDDYIKRRDGNSVECNNATELRRVFKAQGVPFSNAISSVKEYRAVIQNDRSLMNTASNARELRQLASVFSLAESNANLRHIEKLVRAVHSKEGKMETIRSMVAAILEEDGVETPSTKLKASNVDEWIKESMLMAHFESIRPDFVKLEQRYDALGHCELQLKALAFGFDSDKILLTEAIEQLERELREIRYQQDEAQKQYDEQSAVKKGLRSDAKADEDSFSKRLDLIEQDHQNWEDLGIEEVKRDLDRLPQWRADGESMQQRLALLTEKHLDIEASYNQRRGQIEISNNAAIESLREKQEQARQQQTDLQRQQQNELRQLEDGFRNQASAAEQQHHQQTKVLELSQQKWQLQIDAVSFTADERQQVELLEGRIERAFSQSQQAENGLEQARREEHKLNQQRQQLQQQLTQQRLVVEQAQQQWNAIDELRFPKDNSLLKFLREEQPDWCNSIGKVIRPELLSRNDLKPVVAAQTSGLYGIALELDRVDPPEYAQDEAQLASRAEQARLKLEQARSAQAELESDIDKQQSGLQQQAEVVIRANTQYQSDKASHARLLDEKRSLLQSQKAALSDRKQQAQQQLKQVQQELAKLNSQYRTFVDELKGQQLEARMDKESFWQERIGNIELQLSQFSADLSSRREQKKTELSECERWYQAELKDRGVDDTQIIELREQIQTLEQRIIKVENLRDKVSDYDRWFATAFSIEQPKLQTQLNIAKQEILSLDQQLATIERDFKTLRNELKQAHGDNDRQLSQSREQLTKLTELLSALAKLTLPGLTATDTVTTAPLDERLRDADEQLKQREQHRSVIKEQVDSFDSQIGHKAGPELAANWEQWRSECIEQSDNGVARLNHIKLVPSLRNLMNHLVPQRIEVLRGLGQTYGMELEGYYAILADIDKRIGTQSSRITKEVSGELTLDGVSGSAVKIRSKIGELEFWDELKQFSAAHQKWRDQGFNDLPGEEYAQLLRRTLEVIGRSALTGSVSKLLEIELRLREGNSDLVIRTDRQLNESSSHGMAYLILCKFLLAFTRLLRGNSNAIIHWPIDELGTLHHGNVKKIFDACENNRIAVLGAFPNPESDVLSLFNNRYIINKQTKQLQVVQPKVSPIAARLAKRQLEEHSA
ncbi:ATP-binding protein [Ferrimonas lipolytica]|uniref:ATP-binding protein n=1 Tax=Ferrimonas lipolytica TaxID=2724191 RepID=A0A6H1UBE9_9GAMM|nr:ATP-binding protein [Ferrimonas lipolytica]QIZ76385.1 ATP-binding protein [Ferrimonas lipolytica]